MSILPLFLLLLTGSATAAPKVGVDVVEDLAFDGNNWLDRQDDDDNSTVQVDPPGDEIKTHRDGDGGGDRIIGGGFASTGEYPFAVNLNFGNCGGTLISSTCVLTAAHCVSNCYQQRVCLGSTEFSSCSGGLVRFSTETIIHQKYNPSCEPSGSGYDIAILRIPAVPCTGNIQPAKLFCSPLSTGTTLVTVGWGRTSPFVNGGSPLLKEALVNIANCNAALCNPPPLNSLVCVNENSGRTCNGDSGGFLGGFSGNSGCGLVAGVTSFVLGSQCLTPSGFSSVDFFCDWIINAYNGVEGFVCPSG